MVRTSKTPIINTSVSTDKIVDVVDVVKVKKEKKIKSVPVVVEELPVLSEVEVETTMVEGSGEPDLVVVDNIPTKMNDFALKLQQIVALVSTTKVLFKALEKVVVREFKISQKASSKKSKRSGNRRPSGFVRPTLISEELATFLGKEIGTEMARTAVSKELNLYIRTNNLQDKDNGRQINADHKLTVLLNLAEGDVLTYFNLQRYMKHHFIKTTPPVELPVPL
jgi:hypothetical protein